MYWTGVHLEFNKKFFNIFSQNFPVSVISRVYKTKNIFKLYQKTLDNILWKVYNIIRESEKKGLKGEIENG